MTTLAPPPAVTAYANAVREHLAGLDPETLDELTGGLEADLAEALAERLPDGGATDLAAVTSVFGSPATYAEELRTAAGVELPEAPSGRTRLGVRDLVRRTVADARTSWDATRTQHAWLGWAVDFLVSLRPAWWLLRGFVLFHLATGLRNPFFGSALDKLLLVALVVASVLWGRQRIGQQRWWRRAGLLASVVALVATLPIMIGLQQRTAYPDGGPGTGGYAQGYADGQMAAGGVAEGVTNLFVYGPDGLPIENAQIVDQNGEPVVLTNPWTGTSWASWETWEWGGDPVPAPVLDGGGLNVYPWAYMPSEALDWDEDGSIIGTGRDAQDARWPAATLFPVATDNGTEASENPSDAASETPSEASEAAPQEATESPSGEASTTPTAEATEPE